MVGGVLVKLRQARVPVVELVEAVAEAKALLHRQVAHVVPLAALDEALLVQVHHRRVVLLNVRLIVVLHAQG